MFYMTETKIADTNTSQKLVRKSIIISQIYCSAYLPTEDYSNSIIHY